jgi:hypothetical protein
MTIRDRGNIKWTAMMLTEHKDALEKWAKQTREITKPLLDEQKLEEMNFLLCQSLVEKTPLLINYFHNKKFISIKGIIHDYHPLNREVFLKNEKGDITTLILSNIIDINQY